MIEHVIRSYTTIDGKEFDDEEAAYGHEYQYIYNHCGIMFFTANHRAMLVVCDDMYNNSEYFTIDRSPQFAEMNKLFLEEVAWYGYGWCLPDDLLEQTATKYVYDEDENEWVPAKE